MKNKRIKFLICFVLTAILTFEAGAFASVEVKQTGKDTAGIELVIDGTTTPTDFIIQVFAPGKNQSNLIAGSSAANAQILIWNKQGVTDENGKFSAEFGIDNTMGEYKVRLYDGKSGVVNNNAGTFQFVDEDNFRILISGLNAAAKSSAAESYILANGDKLNIFDTQNISVAALAEIVEEEIKSGDFDADSFENSKKRADLINLIGYLNQSETEDVFSFADALGQISEYKAFTDVNNYFENAGKSAAVTEKLLGKGIKDIISFKKRLAEAMVLTIVHQPNGIDNVKEALAHLGKLAGVKTNGASDDKIYSVCGVSYENIAAFNAAVSKKPGSGSQGGGGGGGAGGGTVSTGTKGDILNADKLDEDETEKPQPIPNDVFIDLEDAIWARNAIVSLTDKGYLRGRAEGIFAPNENILREEFVKILVCAFDKGEDADESTRLPFKDVDVKEWYYPYLVKAVNWGLVKGHSEDLFGIGECITRQDMAVMIYRAAANGELASEDYSTEFTDFDTIDSYATEAISFFVERGIINGMGDGSIRPKRHTTRAEAAKVIYEVLKQ